MQSVNSHFKVHVYIYKFYTVIQLLFLSSQGLPLCSRSIKVGNVNYFVQVWVKLVLEHFPHNLPLQGLSKRHVLIEELVIL